MASSGWMMVVGAAAVLAGCSSEATEGPDRGAAGVGPTDGSGGVSAGTGGGSWGFNRVTITGNNQGEPVVTSTILGDDYQGGIGSECSIDDSWTGTAFRIFARDGTMSPSPSMRLDLFDFDPDYTTTRTERLTPDETGSLYSFTVSATAYDGTSLFIYQAPESYSSTDLAMNPSCVTTFSSLEGVISGVLVCENIVNGQAGKYCNLSIDFTCMPIE